MTSLASRLRAIASTAGLLTCAAAPLLGQAAGDDLDVLFIGNSYIYFNNLPAMMEGLARGLGAPAVHTALHTHGGSTLRAHLDDGHLPGVLEPSETTGHSWDIVVLQEQSALGVPAADPETGTLGGPDSFHAATRDLTRVIADAGADPVLYMTWAKERFPDQTQTLARAYDDIGNELGVSVAPVGLAWARVREERPDLTLFMDDGSHPSPAGSYLAACVFYAQLSGQSPVGGPSEISGPPWDNGGVTEGRSPEILVSLSDADANYLQRVAWETVQSRAPGR